MKDDDIRTMTAASLVMGTILLAAATVCVAVAFLALEMKLYLALSLAGCLAVVNGFFGGQQMREGLKMAEEDLRPAGAKGTEPRRESCDSK